MPTFIEGKPIETREPAIAVDGLREGMHRFQLEVENAAGRRSVPDVVTVTVQSGRPNTITRPA